MYVVVYCKSKYYKEETAHRKLSIMIIQDACTLSLCWYYTTQHEDCSRHPHLHYMDTLPNDREEESKTDHPGAEYGLCYCRHHTPGYDQEYQNIFHKD